jgi:hypothetical protein
MRESLICDGCGSTWTDAQISQERNRIGATILSCCPERNMVSVWDWRANAVAEERERALLQAAEFALQNGSRLGATNLAEGIMNLRAVEPAAPAPAVRHDTRRWDVEPQADGSVLICKGDHEKGERCEYVRFVRSAPAVQPTERPYWGTAFEEWWTREGLSLTDRVGRKGYPEGETRKDCARHGFLGAWDKLAAAPAVQWTEGQIDEVTWAVWHPHTGLSAEQTKNRVRAALAPAGEK